MKLFWSWIGLLLLSWNCHSTKAALNNSADESYLFIGTYTRKEGHVDGKAEGIYTYRMNPKNGELTYVGGVGKVINPSYLAVHPNKKYLYAINELANDTDNNRGTITSYNIDQTTKQLTFLNTQSLEPNAPCYISVDAKGTHCLVASYKTGTIAVLPILADGSLATPTDTIQHIGSSKHARQQSPHAHYIDFSPDGQWVLSVDLGTDKVLVFQLDKKTGKLIQKNTASVTAGAGSRHLSFHPQGKWVYVVNELNSTIEAFTFNQKDGSMERFQIISTLPENYNGEGNCAAIHVHPNGKFLYASNRKDHHSIAVFEVDPQTGKLRLIEHEPTQGRTPRDFTIDPSGNFLLVANQDTDTVVTFEIDKQTGALTPNGKVSKVLTPVCLKFWE